ncbi:MAG TPA: MmgE/PrpD family protein [Micropepsaceae bacterium]|nr:MmgE/PrpD family protein [Micropepsaceae bacterium]
MIEPLREISTTTRRLSAHIAGALSQSLPPAVMEKARQHILDTMAAMISGTHLPPGKLAIPYVASLGGVREASVVGTRLLTSCVHAALANGMLAHADETDDSHAPSRTHPGCAVIPAALAVAERVHASGEDFIRAVVLGYDVAARVNYALDPEALAAALRSTHSIGGTFGAGAAAGALLGLDERQIRHLLSFCAQQASGIGCHVRDPEHVEKAFDFGGMPARNGVTAATMVASGMTGVDDVFSGERNFLDAFATHPAPERLSEELGQRFEILGTNIKKWPVGSPAQAALDALTVLMQSDRIGPGDVESIEVHLPGRSARTVDNAPMSNLNLQHLMAMLLIDGALSFDSIHAQERMQEPAIFQLRGKIVLVESEELAQAKPRRQAIVAVKTRDGRSLSKRVLAVRGTADNPMNQVEVEAKAFDLIGSVLGARRAKAILRAIASLQTVPDVVALRRLWQPSGKTGMGA